MSSPFADVLAGRELPRPFRLEFLEPPVLLVGAMDRIWHRPRWIRPLLACLARVDTLFPEQGEDVPTTMLVTADHRWLRTFSVARRVRRIDAAMSWDERRGRIVERMGPRGALELTWQVSFVPPDAIEIVARMDAVRVRGRRLALPRLLQIDAHTVDTARGDRLRCELTVRHPLLGPIFGYDGTFEVRRL
jgi:Domain of unknown function (DUF4166)